MKSKVFSIIALVAVAVFMGSASFANVPPPPVNQLIGVDDTLFNFQTAAQCIECHTGTVDQHHMLYGTALPAAGTCTVISPARPCLSNNTCETLTTPVCNIGGTACPVGTCSISTGISCIVDTDCPAGEVCEAGDCPNFRNGEVCGQPFCSVNSAVKDDDVGNNGIDTNYGCLNCHEQQIVGGVIKFIVERDCLVCHVQNPNAPTIHHRDGGEAKAGRCSGCHGDIVDNIEGCKESFCGTDRGATQLIPCTSNANCTAALVPQKLCRISGEPCTTAATCPTVNGATQTCVNQLWCGYYGETGTENCTDGHEIPTYTPSMVTPLPSQHASTCGGIVGGVVCEVDDDCTPPDLCVQDPSLVETPGGCAFCHDVGIDTVSGVDVVDNHDTHHDIFLHKTNSGGNLTQVCSWCHEAGYPHVPAGEERTRMRWCENCHGYESLHNIQADSPNTGNIGSIVVGGEDAYWGHVGRDNPANPNNDSDCWGCHGFPPISMASAPGTGPIVPSLAGSSASTITAGAETTLTLTGVAFTNVIGDFTWLSKVKVGDLELDPTSIDQGTITVTIPALDPGIYDIRVVKGDVASNPISVNCVPQVKIISYTCEGGVLTVNGSGFGDEPPAGAEEFINVKIGDMTLEITSWTDSQIVAETSVCGEPTVNTLFGSAGACFCAADASGDKKVDLGDLVILKQEFGTKTPQNADFDGDGNVDLYDLVIMKQQFGRAGCC